MISTTLVPCLTCNTMFQKRTIDVNRSKTGHHFCSYKCVDAYKSKNGTTRVKCITCNADVVRRNAEIKKSKSGNNFCSKSCAATYNNKHKTFGTRRSKLEEWLEKKLTTQYPYLDIQFNSKQAIGSELDIFIPSLNLAIELNGIFHYIPVFGNQKLSSIQRNDSIKIEECIKHKIELLIIDTSHMKYLTEVRVTPILNQICKLIESK